MISDESGLSSTIASLSMEGLTVTEEEIQLAKKCLRHEITYDDAVKYLIDKYSVVNVDPQCYSDSYITLSDISVAYLESEFRKGLESAEKEGWVSEEELRAKYR